MSVFQHILFPVDLTERSEAAVPWVKEMRERNDCRLTIFHSAEIPWQWYSESAMPVDVAQNACDEWLRSSAQRTAAFGSRNFCELSSGDRAASVCVLGDAGKNIMEFIDNNAVDLVMMPTHGRGPFRSLLLGSVTAKVLHDAHCAVWTTAHVEQALNHKPMKRILCAVDLTGERQHIVQEAAHLAGIFGGEVKLVHSVFAAEARPERYLDAEFQEFLVEQARTQLKRLQIEMGTSFEAEVVTGHVPEAVRDAAQRFHADVVIIGRGCLQAKMGRLRTHAHAIIRESPCPVISF